MFKDKCFIALAFFIFTSFSNLVNASPDVELYAELPKISKMAISPDASLIAYNMLSDGQNVLVIRKKSDFSIVGGARINQIEPQHVYFINENIVIMIGGKNVRLRGFWGRHDTSSAYAYNIKKNKMYPLLSPGFGIYTGQTQLGNIIGVSPDRKHVFMPAFQDESILSVFKVTLDRQKKPKRFRMGTKDTRDFFMNSKGQVIARERFNNEDNLHIIEARVNDTWKEVYREETNIPTKGFNGITSDEKHLMYYSYNGNRKAYYKMSLIDGSTSEPLFNREDKDVESVVQSINRVVYGVRYSGFTPTYEFFDKKLNARMRGIGKAFPDNFVSIKDFSNDWKNILFYIDGGESSGDYFLYNNSQLQYVTSLRPNLLDTPVNQIVEYEYQTRDDYTIPTLLTYPHGVEKKNLPAIMMPHGGPEAYDRKQFDYMSQYFASQGYLVIQPQFRGSTGFGWDHTLAGRGQWGKRMQDDLTDALTTLIGEGIVDKNRTCIVGASYGGYAALAGATFTPDLYKCAVSINGVSDVERMLKQEKYDFGEDHWVVSYWQDVIANGEIEEEFLKNISPINFVEKVQVPVLLIHGTRDKIVPFRQSKYFVDEMEDADKEVEFVELKKGNHHLSSAENRMKAMKAIDKFLKQHIN